MRLLPLDGLSILSSRLVLKSRVSIRLAYTTLQPFGAGTVIGFLTRTKSSPNTAKGNLRPITELDGSKYGSISWRIQR
jgi:hypothetical protein